jgi:purine-binding chemotaxis protein CheW
VTGRAIDWVALHRRLELAMRWQDRAQIGADAKAQILRARARAAAREPAPADAGDRIQVVEFLLAYERHAVETSWVREVVALRELTPLPGVPAFVAGLINVRGRIVAVVDLKAFFDLPRKGLPDLNRVIVIGDDSIEFGLLVDAVHGVVELRRDELQPALPTLSGVRAEFLCGIAPPQLAVLDAGRILRDPRVVVHDGVG